mmetsp:Transcript_8629/g.21577  ORF Transcript_8629/g.21577 Transcript_8629/m.21577 type:complete len:85 (+) Transcript_8629:232-486(+)
MHGEVDEELVNEEDCELGKDMGGAVVALMVGAAEPHIGSMESVNCGPVELLIGPADSPTGASEVLVSVVAWSDISGVLGSRGAC